MILKFLILCALISIAKCEDAVHPNYLNALLERTTNFFENLKRNHEFETSSKEVLMKIDDKVSQYVRNATERVHTRKKRDLSNAAEFEKGIYVAEDFRDILLFNGSNIRDVSFFSIQNETDVVWFVAILDPSKLTLHLVNNNTVDQSITCNRENGAKVISASYGQAALVITQDLKGAITVFRVTTGKSGHYILYRTQDFESFNVTHLSTWQGMNQLFLAVSSYTNVSIYTWLGEHFDLVQVIDLGAQKLLPFSMKGFMHLAIVGRTTMILKHSLRSNRFEIVQRLPASRDVSSFRVKEGHFNEHFLSLATESSIVLYKEVHDRFVPFQRIASAKSTIPLTINKAILLLSLEDDTVMVAQYDGWSFVELSVRIRDVEAIRRVYLEDKELLLVQHRNNSWRLMQPVWDRRKSWKGLQEEIRAWCKDTKDKARRMPNEIPELKGPVRLLRGHVGQLFTQNINGHDESELRDTTIQYKRIASKLQATKEALSKKRRKGDAVFSSLRAKKVEVNCKSECKIAKVNGGSESEYLSKLKKEEPTNQTLIVKKLSLRNVENWRCPLLALTIDSVSVTKLFNGYSTDDLQKKLLKVTGDQEISGLHQFHTIEVKDAIIPLDIATRSTKQTVVVEEMRVRDLRFKDGGFLLPLNGSETTIDGTIEASKVRVKGNVTLHGGLKGEGARRYAPLTLISEPTVLFDDYTFRNVTIEDFLSSNEIRLGSERSIGEILKNGISLRDDVPVALKFNAGNVKWDNVTLKNPKNWITAHSKERVVITGVKSARKNVALRKSTYDTLHFPKIKTRVCGSAAVAPEIRTSTLTVDYLNVKKLHVSNATGNLGQNVITKGSTSFEPLDFSSRNVFFRKLNAKNVSIEHVENLDLEALQKIVNAWTSPNVFKGPLESSDATINFLRTPVDIRLDFQPKIIANALSKKNTYVGKINGVDFVEFLANFVNIQEILSLRNIMFRGGLTTNSIRATYHSIKTLSIDSGLDLQTKRISGNLQTTMLNVPRVFAFKSNDISPSIIVQGSVTFKKEPRIENVNAINLKELSESVWLNNSTSVFSGKHLVFKNLSMEGEVNLNNALNTLSFGSWNEFSQRVLSKTKAQDIKVSATLKSVETLNVVGSRTASLKLSTPEFEDMFDNAFVKNKDQVVKSTWRFEKMGISGKLKVGGRVNNMNLRTDVVRKDVEKNIVVGRKTIQDLATENLYGLNFDKWSANAVKPNARKLVVIKGRKVFNSTTVDSLSVFGTVSGRRMEEALLKSKDQRVCAAKKIKGSVNASSILVDGLINDVNLTELIHDQLKKREPVQRIKTRILLDNDLKILGNLTVNGLFNETELEKLAERSKKLMPVIDDVIRYSEVSEAINVALQNRATYINKLELVKPDSVNLPEISYQEDSLSIDGERLCESRNNSLLCNDKNLASVISGSNSSASVMTKLITLKDVPFAIVVKSDFISIYLYDNSTNSFSLQTGLYVPNVIGAFVEEMSDSLWISLQLSSQCFLLHYKPGGTLQQYVLPIASTFGMSRTPSNQLLLLASNGVWNLDGLSRPENIISAPLVGKVEAHVVGANYYIRCVEGSNVTLFRAHYVGN